MPVTRVGRPLNVDETARLRAASVAPLALYHRLTA